MPWIVKRKWDGRYFSSNGSVAERGRARQFYSSRRAIKRAVVSLPVTLKHAIGVTTQNRKLFFDAVYELEEI